MKHLVRAVIALCFLAGLIPAIQASAQSSCSSGGTQAPVELAVPNLTGQRVHAYWLDYQCNEQLMDTMEPGWIFYSSTYDGHEWIFRDDSGQEISRFVTSSSAPMVLLGGGNFSAEPVTTNCSRVDATVSSQGTTLRVTNNTDQPALLFWIDTNCVEWLYWVVPAHDRVSQDAWVGHDWVVRWADGRTIEHTTLTAGANRIVIDPPPQPAASAATATPAPAVVASTATPAPAVVAATPTLEAVAGLPVTESGCEIQTVTADMGLDPFYTSYCTYNGLRFLASDAVDAAALDQAWLTAANLWFHRPDVVESLVEMGFFITVIAEDEFITDVPELAYLLDDTSVDYDSFRAYSKVLEEPRLVAIAEENLLCASEDAFAGENLLIGRLASLTRFAFVRDLDPGHTDRLGAVRQSAIDAGLWASSAWVTESNSNYWDNGVQAAFNSAPGGLLTGPTDDAINTRLELAQYDPQLLALIDEAFQIEDWTPACPAA